MHTAKHLYLFGFTLSFILSDIFELRLNPAINSTSCLGFDLNKKALPILDETL
jgi:hypothetical protein